MTQLLDFEERGERNDRVVQMALREIDARLLAEAAVAMNDEERNIVFRNMSKRAHRMIVEEIERAEETTSEIAAKRAKEFFVQKLRKYRDYVSNRPESVDSGDLPRLDTTDDESIVESFVSLAKLANQKGRLALEDVEMASELPIATKGMQLVVDGWDPLQARAILEQMKRTHIQELERRIDMIIEGIDSLMSDDIPIAVEEKLRAYIG